MTAVIHPVLGETTLTLAAAAGHLPPIAGKPRSVASLRAWIAGVKVGGRTVRLEAVKVGRQWYTSAEALGRFLDASVPTEQRAVPTPAARATATQSQKTRLLAEFAEARKAVRS